MFAPCAPIHPSKQLQVKLQTDKQETENSDYIYKGGIQIVPRIVSLAAGKPVVCCHQVDLSVRHEMRQEKENYII